MLNEYLVVLTWRMPTAQLERYRLYVRAENVDDAIREAKFIAGAPESATSETRRI